MKWKEERKGNNRCDRDFTSYFMGRRKGKGTTGVIEIGKIVSRSQMLMSENKIKESWRYSSVKYFCKDFLNYSILLWKICLYTFWTVYSVHRQDSGDELPVIQPVHIHINKSSEIFPCHVPKYILASNQNKGKWKKAYKCLYYQNILTTQKKPLNYILHQTYFEYPGRAGEYMAMQHNNWHLLARGEEMER